MSQGSQTASALRLRPRLAARTTVVVGSISKRLGLGGGSVIGGRVGLVLDPNLVRDLALNRTVALVSGTNGKTTTTRFLAAALGGPSSVATSTAGANLPSGIAAALSAANTEAPAVLEVDEAHLPIVMDQLSPSVVTLLNLSRDQLDRVSEVRMVASRWGAALAGRETTVVVANADDPLLAWAAQRAPHVIWVAAGELWHGDTVGCPSCEGRIVFDNEGWSCRCGFARPVEHAALRGEELVFADGRRFSVRLSVPGRFNRANAAIAAVSASALGVDVGEALIAMKQVTEVEGRFSQVQFARSSVRLLLAKNPAGWTELLGLLAEGSNPVVVGINARVADGHDPSWLWDVAFERLGGRLVVATGERRLDLAVRLRHAGVEHLVVEDQLQALHAAEAGELDYVGNYTAFQQLRRALAERPARRPDAAISRLAPSHRAESVVHPRTDGSAPPPRREGDGVSALRVVVVHPDLLGTYGDSGNGRILADRAGWRGIDVELVMASSDRELPETADLYCLGGGEDGPQVQSAELMSEGQLQRAVDHGAKVLAVCAGYQVLGHTFPDAYGSIRPGVGLLDVSTIKGPRKRLVGEIVAEALDPNVGRITGFENHAGVTHLGEGVGPFARVVLGIGNGTGDHSEGALTESIVGTYMHGPVLARNPSLADLLIAKATKLALAPLDDEEEEALRAERLANTYSARGRALRSFRLLRARA